LRQAEHGTPLSQPLADRINFSLDNRAAVEHDLNMIVDDIKTAVMPACREFHVRRLEAFGSVARGTATATSDIDLLVEFSEPDQAPARRFFGLLHRLESELGCKIDLLTINSLRNPYFKARILKEKISVYEG
jgi:predicted nucleotidyltransferase